MVSRIPGAKSFVELGGGPALVDDQLVDALRAREGRDGVIAVNHADVGSNVRVTRGPFRGLEAVLERRLPARERVVLLLSMLQRKTRVEVSGRCIAKAY
jgi:transcription antitermination factor NusG